MRWTWVAALWLCYACAFDDAALDDRGPCDSDEACGRGSVCLDEVCTPRDLLPSEEDDASADADEADASPDAIDSGTEADARDADDVMPDATDVGSDTGDATDARTDVTEDADVAEPDADATDPDADPADVALVCNPGTRVCEGPIAIECSPDGLSAVETDCRLSPVCLGTRFGCVCASGQCEPRTCRPGVATCDGNTRVQCNGAGTGIDILGNCPSGERCAGGVCVALACDGPEEEACEADAIVRCDEGTLSVLDDCAERDAICVSDALGAFCEPYTCTPEALRCSRDGAAVEACGADGLAFEEVERCVAGEVCRGGACAPLVCSPSAARCAGPLLRGLCSANGDAETLAPCEAGTFCLEETAGAAVCAPQICAPLSTRCDDDSNAVETCDTRGAGFLSPLPCVDDTVCSEGACVARVCEPGTTACVGDEVFVCDEVGAGTRLLESCLFGCALGACLPTQCGDGTVDGDAGEICDDANVSICDGCESCAPLGVAAVQGASVTESDVRLSIGESDFTFEVWIQTSSSGAIAGVGVPSDNDGVLLRVSEGRPEVEVRFGDGRSMVLAGDPIDDGAWHHIAAQRFALTGLALFVDGELVDAVWEPLDRTSIDGDLRIWIASEGTLAPATGAIDELRFSTALRYRNRFLPPRTLGAEEDTQAWYRFDDASALGADWSERGRGLAFSNARFEPDDCHGIGPGAVVCGDGVRSRFEECDDGNATDGDGCSSSCFLELPCAGELGPDAQCYLFAEATRSWTDARDDCRTWGGELVRIDDARENTWMTFLRGLSADAWIGLNDRGEEDAFDWVGNDDPGYRNWQSGQPNNFFFSEDCVRINGTGDDEAGRWNDNNCDERKRYVCER